MKKQSISRFLRCVVFLLIAALLLTIVSEGMQRKTSSGAWNYMTKFKEFYEQDENSLEYVCLGSSHAYCTVNPLEVWKESGIKGFVLATQQQPLTASYHYLVEAFKTQKPKVVILEGFMGHTTDASDGVLYDAIDPLKLSLNKIKMINALVDKKDRAYYYFNVMKYHSRWEEVSAGEFGEALVSVKDTYKGYVAIEREFKGQNVVPDYGMMEDVKLPTQNLNALNKILELTKENGAELLLMIAPYDAVKEDIAEMFKAERLWAEQNGVFVLDYSLIYDEVGIDPQNDYYDGGHLDVSGAAKASRYLATYLKEMGLESKTPKDELWEKDYENYYKNFIG